MSGSSPLRPISFVLASTNHGTMILNRHDYHAIGDTAYGVGHQILSNSAFDPEELRTIVRLLDARRENYGDGVVMVDCGANMGVHSIECARHMYGWGSVIAYEPQERIFYALAGNIVINNCMNARAIWSAVGDQDGFVQMPAVDYSKPGSFGSLEIKPGGRRENIGQPVDFSESALTPVQIVRLDSVGLPRVDLVKIDVEGMEIDVLRGAQGMMESQKPYLIVERIKSDETELRNFMEKLGYILFVLGINFVAVHRDDPIAPFIRIQEPVQTAQ